eukprot:3668731-Amphidinium_carterae.2
MIELYEETAPAILFLNFLKKHGVGTLLGDLKAHYTPQVARPHRVTGEVPTRIVRCFGSVPSTKLLQILTLSGQQDCIIKPCQRHVEDQFNLTNVWASSNDRSLVMQQVSTIAHHGVVRTRANKFLIRCAHDQVATIRQQVASDDLWYAQAPALVVTRKWKVHHVPVAITAQRISDALHASLSWSQIPIGPSCSRTKASTWTIGAKAPVPQATMSVVQPAPVATPPTALSPALSLTQVIKENLRQPERTLSSSAHGKLLILLKITWTSALNGSPTWKPKWPNYRPTWSRRMPTPTKISRSDTNSLEAHRSYTEKVIKQLDDSFCLRIKEGAELVSQLRPPRKRQADGEGADDVMES